MSYDGYEYGKDIAELIQTAQEEAFEGLDQIQLNKVYPIDPESQDDVLAIDRKTKEDLRLKHRIYMEADWDCNTTAHTVLSNIIKVLNAQICEQGVRILDPSFDNTFPFYDLIEIAASNKKNKAAEKMGNINVKFFPGGRVEQIISDDTANGDAQIQYISMDKCYVIENNEALTKAMLRIDALSRRELKDKYEILMPKEWQTIAVTYVLLDNLYHHIIMKLVSTEKKQVMINFNDLIEFHAQKKGNKAQIFIRPGFESKLIIKSDDATEYDEDDDY